MPKRLHNASRLAGAPGNLRRASSEIENETEEQFDANLLSQVILQHGKSPIGELVNHLIDAARKFSLPEHRWDDITIMGVERKE